MVNFTLEDVARVTIAVAWERPDHKYRTHGDASWCLYVHGNEPGCLFGHALARLGVNVAELENVGIAKHLSRWFGGERDDPPYVPFSNAQGLQDKREPWGTCIVPLLVAYPHLAPKASGE